MTTDLTTAQTAREIAEAKLATVEATLEATAMERTLRLIESPQPVVVPWSEYPGADTWGMPLGFRPPYIWTQPDDHSEGRCLPVYENAQDVRRIVAESRSLVELFPVAKGLLRKLSDYIIGTGWDFTVKPKKAYRNDPRAIQLAGIVQAALDGFLEYNDVVGGLDRVMHEDARRDGNVFATLYPEDDQVRLELTDPGCIAEPQAPKPLQRFLKTDHKLNGWWHGVHTLYSRVLKRDDANRPMGYHAVFDRLGDQWDYLPASRVEHIKCNLPMSRVGVPDFFFVQSELQASHKIRRNTAEGVAILAAIVMIRQHAEGTSKSSIESMVSNTATYSREKPTQFGNRTTYGEQVPAGTTKDVPHGMTATLGPLGQLRSAVYVEVDQHILRIAGNFWGMPSYMSTAQADDVNYASSLTTESPFVKYCEADQAKFGGHFCRINWKALRLLCECGSLRGQNWQQIRSLLEINGEYVSPASRDRLQQAQVNQILQTMGIMSDRSIAADMGLDLDEETQNGIKKPPVDAAMRDGDGDGAVLESTRAAAFSEAVLNCRTLKEARAIAGAV